MTFFIKFIYLFKLLIFIFIVVFKMESSGTPSVNPTTAIKSGSMIYICGGTCLLLFIVIIFFGFYALLACQIRQVC